MEVEEAIRTRRTHKAFRPESVDRSQLEEILDLARWAPNHNLTNPWRFRVIGEVAGRPTLIVEHVYRLLDEAAPAWPQPVTPDQRTTRIRIDGQPKIDLTRRCITGYAACTSCVWVRRSTWLRPRSSNNA